MKARALIAIAALAACHPATPAVTVPAPPPTAPLSDDAPAKAPPPPREAADPAPVVDGDTTDAWVRGLHVIVKRTPGLEETATQLYVRGGVRDWDAATAGIGQLAIVASTYGGTETRPRDRFTQELSDLGSSLDGYATNDWSVMYAWSLTPAWDATFALLADAFLHPALPDAQVEVYRARQLAAIASERESPDGRLALAMREVMFAGHPYARRAIGTATTVPGLTVAQLRAHLAKLRETSRLVLVVVGDVAPEHVLETARAAFAGIPRGSYSEVPLPALAPRAPATTVVEQALPTNYLEVVMPGPTWRQPDDLVAGRLAISVLSHREFEEVRTKRNLSYAPNAFFDTGNDTPIAGLYVTAVDPNTTLKVMYAEVEKLRTVPLDDRDLAAAKASYLTGVFTANEAPNDQATQLALAQLRGGDWRLARDLAARIKAVTAAQIQAWARTYLAKPQVILVGDPKKLDRALAESL